VELCTLLIRKLFGFFKNCSFPVIGGNELWRKNKNKLWQRRGAGVRVILPGGGSGLALRRRPGAGCASAALAGHLRAGGGAGSPWVRWPHPQPGARRHAPRPSPPMGGAPTAATPPTPLGSAPASSRHGWGGAGLLT